MGHRAADIQRQQAPAVLAHQLLLAHHWASHAAPTTCASGPAPPGAAVLSALQASALRLEPSLLRVPQPALHANLVWLLPVHQEFDRPKDELWERHSPRWIATLADAAGRTSSFHLNYCGLVATNSAVTTVADEPDRLTGDEFPGAIPKGRTGTPATGGAHRCGAPHTAVIKQIAAGADSGWRRATLPGALDRRVRPATRSWP